MSRAAAALALLTAVAVLTALAARAQHNYTVTETNVVNSTDLLTNIRRQLMANNYDYMPVESEEPFPARAESPAAEPTLPTALTWPSSVAPIGSHVNDIFLPLKHSTDHEPLDNIDSKDDHTVAKNDLLYYVHDDRLKKDGEMEDMLKNNTFNQSDVGDNTSPKTKYKMLKVKQPHSNRRSNSYRRFLQEETEDGVAIINLDNEPFPEFRLPHSRRQYMDPGEDLSFEIPPAEDLSEEMIAMFDAQTVNSTSIV